MKIRHDVGPPFHIKINVGWIANYVSWTTKPYVEEIKVIHILKCLPIVSRYQNGGWIPKCLLCKILANYITIGLNQINQAFYF